VPKTLSLGRWQGTQRWVYRHGILRNCFLLALMIRGNKGGAVCVRDVPSGQPPRKKRKLLEGGGFGQ